MNKGVIKKTLKYLSKDIITLIIPSDNNSDCV